VCYLSLSVSVSVSLSLSLSSLHTHTHTHTHTHIHTLRFLCKSMQITYTPCKTKGRNPTFGDYIVAVTVTAPVTAFPITLPAVLSPFTMGGAHA
jgi:hypothetical protein